MAGRSCAAKSLANSSMDSQYSDQSLPIPAWGWIRITEIVAGSSINCRLTGFAPGIDVWTQSTSFFGPPVCDADRFAEKRVFMPLVFFNVSRVQTGFDGAPVSDSVTEVLCAFWKFIAQIAIRPLVESFVV
jgi:hypothetical protein